MPLFNPPAAAAGGGTWPVLIASMQGANGAAVQSITGQTFATLNVNATTDSHTGFNATTDAYTIPAGQSGTYQINMKMRPVDANAGGSSYGIGCDTTNGDSASFFWGLTNATGRHGLANARTVDLAAGAALKVFSYFDKVGSIGIYSAELIIYRIR